MWIAAGILTGAYEGGNINAMGGLVAIGMFCPLLRALITNAISPKEQRIKLGISPRVRKDIRFYVLAWFVPPVLSLAGAAVFFHGTGYPGFPVTGILSMIVFCTAASILLAWLREKTESIWPCALAHGSINASAGLGVIFCTAGPTLLGPSVAGLVGGIPMIVLATVVWLRHS